MATPLKDFPNQTVADRASESGKLEAAVRQWAREVTFAVRALQNRPDATTAAASAVVASATVTATPVISGVSSVSWGTGIRGNIDNQIDLAAKLAAREPAFGSAPQDESIPYFNADGSRGWFSLQDLDNALPSNGFITAVSVPTELGASHGTVVVSNGSAITLPKASNYKNKQYNIIRSGTADVVITPNGVETISGQSSLTLIVQWASVVVISDGLNWVICS